MKPTHIALSLLIVITLAACGSTPTPVITANTAAPTASAIPAHAPTLAPTSQAPAATANQHTQYPLTIENCGQTLTFQKPPERVLVNYQTMAEALVTLGLADRIVAVNFSKTMEPPADIAAGVNGLKFLSPHGKGIASKEVALSTRPDLVIAGSATDDFDASHGLATRDEYQAAGAQVYVIMPGCGVKNTPVTLEDTFQDILNYGKIFGVSAKAEALVQHYRDQITEVKRRVAGHAPVRAAIYDAGEGPLGFYASGLYADMVTLAGGVNVFADQAESYAQVSREAVAASTPDIWIIDDYANAPAPVEKRAAYLITTFPLIN